MSNICKFFVFALLLNAFSVGCGKGKSGNNGKSSPETEFSNSEKETHSSKPDALPSKETLAQTLVKKVTDIEVQLKEYGIHMKEEEVFSLGIGEMGKRYVKVSIKKTAQDGDLVTLGLDPLNRDKLFENLSALIEDVESQKLRDFSESTDIAIMKIELVRGQLKLPKLLELYNEVLLAKANHGIPLTNGNSVRLMLWDVEKLKGEQTISNGEVIIRLTKALELNSKFNAMKKTFLEGFIEGQEAASRIDAKSMPRYLSAESKKRADLIKLLKKINREDFLTPNMSKLASDLKDKVLTLPTEEQLNLEILKDLNSQAIQSERTSLLEQLKKSVDQTMSQLKMTFTTDGQIDSKSLSAARVGNYDFDKILESSKQRLGDKLKDFQDFSKAFKVGKDDSLSPEETLIVDRAKAILLI